MKKYRFRYIPILFILLTIVLGCSQQEKQDKQKSSKNISPAETTLSHSDKIIVGHEDTFPPMEFRTPNGDLVGYDIDLTKEAFKRMGLEFEYRLLDWTKKDDALLKDKTVDMIWSGLNISEERSQIYGFSEPYLDNRQIIVVNVDSPIQTKSDLSGKVVGLQDGTFSIPIIERYNGSSGPVGRIQPFPEAAQALTAMLENKIDVVVMDETQGRYFISRSPGKFRVLQEDFGEQAYGVAMRKEDTELIKKVNEALASLKNDGTERRIYDKWFKEQ